MTSFPSLSVDLGVVVGVLAVVGTARAGDDRGSGGVKMDDSVGLRRSTLSNKDTVRSTSPNIFGFVPD